MPVSEDTEELIDLLCNELADIVQSVSAKEPKSDNLSELLDEQVEYAENIGNAAHLVGMDGVAKACSYLIHNFELLRADTPRQSVESFRFWSAWPGLLQSYLQLMQNPERVSEDPAALIDYLSHASWPVPLDEQSAASLRQTDAPWISTPPSLTPATREVSVTPAIASLALPADVDDALLQILLAELPEQVEAFDRAVEGYLLSRERERLRSAQRIAHSLKGSANLVGIAGMANLMHYIEELLEHGGGDAQGHSLGYLLLESADCLAAMVDFLTGYGPEPDNLAQVIQAVADTLPQRFSGQAAPPHPSEDGPSPVPSADNDRHGRDKADEAIFNEAIAHSLLSCQPPRGEIHSQPRGELPHAGPAASDAGLSPPLAASPSQSPALQSTTSGPSPRQREANPDVLNARAPWPDCTAERAGPVRSDGGTEGAEGSASGALEAEQALQPELSIKESQAEALLQLNADIQTGNTRLLGRIGTVALGVQAAMCNQEKLRQVALRLEDFVKKPPHSEDSDCNGQWRKGGGRQGEIQSFVSEIQEVTTDTHAAVSAMASELEEIKAAIRDQRERGTQSQEIVRGMRMLPASTLATRFRRCVRQASRLTGTPAQLEIVGDSVLVDARMLKMLAEPLMHLLRNAVDHGLETRESERVASGKSRVGQIVLSFKRNGDNLCIKCCDDGCGIDYQAVARAAKAKGLAPAGAEFSEQDWQRLILTPGFSTRKKATQTSGRGLGLDIVSQQVKYLKGQIGVQSQAGEGTTVTIDVPISQISAHVLIVKLGSTRVCVLSKTVDEVLYVDKQQLEVDADGRRHYQRNEGERLPVFHIDEICALPAAPQRDKYTAMMVSKNAHGQRCGVLVEAITGSEDFVIKPLSQYTYQAPGMVGACILEDGKVSPVLDMLQLPELSLSEASYEAWRARFEQRLSEMGKSAGERALVLIVDDSLSARRALVQFVQDMGMDVCTARDGFEALQILKNRQPAIMLVDMEMPRMTGLELTGQVRAHEQTRDIPIVVVSSRTTAKHRAMADKMGANAYVNKPWSDDELLTAIEQHLPNRH